MLLLTKLQQYKFDFRDVTFKPFNSLITKQNELMKTHSGTCNCFPAICL